jgi:hypothetical protein
MDLDGTLRELRFRRDRLAALIEQLETQNRSGDDKALVRRSNRGRKFIGIAERREVVEGMKKYWANRRKAQGAG